MLRVLKAALVEIVNTRDFARLGKLANTPFSATFVTQDHFIDLATAKAFFDGLFERKVLPMESVAFAAEADTLSTIYSGTLAVTTGTTVETYALADGRAFDIDGRWTALSVDESGGWRLAAFHSSVSR